MGVGAPRVSLEIMRGSATRRRKELIVRAVFASAAALGLVISLTIVLALAGEAVLWLTRIDLRSLWGQGWFPRSDEFDLLTLFAGTMMIAVIAMAVAPPLGLGAATYLSEYASPRTRQILKPPIETPAGIAVGILTIPLVATVTEDALHSVPAALREAAYGIGARRRTVTTKVVFPAAVSGVVASLILGLARAVGETMVVAIAAGATGTALRTFNPLEGGQTMTGAISSLAIGSDQVRGSGNAFLSLYFVGLLLFAVTFALNVVSERFVRRVRRMY